jgi:hypothetical protein
MNSAARRVSILKFISSDSRGSYGGGRDDKFRVGCDAVFCGTSLRTSRRTAVVRTLQGNVVINFISSLLLQNAVWPAWRLCASHWWRHDIDEGWKKSDLNISWRLILIRGRRDYHDLSGSDFIGQKGEMKLVALPKVMWDETPCSLVDNFSFCLTSFIICVLGVVFFSSCCCICIFSSTCCSC